MKDKYLSLAWTYINTFQPNDFQSQKFSETSQKTIHGQTKSSELLVNDKKTFGWRYFVAKRFRNKMRTQYVVLNASKELSWKS